MLNLGCLTSKKVILAAALVLFAGCGGGGGDGGGGGGGGTPAPALPQALSFSSGAPSTAGKSMMGATFSGYSSLKDMTMTSLAVSGTYDRVTLNASLNSTPVSRMVMNTGSLLGQIAVQVVQTARWTGDNHPSEGAFQADQGAVQGANVVRLAVNANVTPGVAGVDISWIVNGVTQTTESMSWSAFETIAPWDVSVPEYRRIAVMAYGTFEYVAEREKFAFDAMEYIFGHNPQLESAGATGVTVSCKSFPGNGSTGSVKYTWVDKDASADINPGDDFTVTYANCWIDDPDDNIDDLYNGTIQLGGYIENATPFSTGFGDVMFQNFTEQETVDNLTIEPGVTTTNGGYTIFVMQM